MYSVKQKRDGGLGFREEEEELEARRGSGVSSDKNSPLLSFFLSKLAQ